MGRGLSKLRITPVGTCRIHTPLKRAVLRYPVEVDLSRNYGYVHTSSEALQQVRFLQGEKTISPEALPFIARFPAEMPTLEAQRWDGTDLAIVEISSSKSIRLGNDFVQVVYLTKAFADFFSNAQRARTYWSLAKLTDRGKLVEYLREQAKTLRLSEEATDVLLRLKPEEQTFKAIMADMAEIAERLGRNRVLFVTHVNALGPDENVVPSRDRLIRWVRMAAERLGLPVYEPTSAMQEFGQERAMERGGLDLTHYTPVFNDKVYDDLHRSFIGAQVQAKVGEGGQAQGEGQVGLLAANLEAMLELGDFFAAARDVHAAVERHPEAPQLRALRGFIRARTGDFRNAAEDFAAVEDTSSLSHPVQVAQLQTLNALGDHEGALDVAERLFADEFASAELYAGASAAAEKVGKPDLAIDYAKLAFRSDPSDLAIALKALQLLIARNRHEEADNWRREVRENSSGTSSRAFEVCAWAVANRDPDLFAASLRAVARADKGGTIDLLEDAFAAGLYKAVAESVPAVAALGRLSRSLAERRNTLLDRLLATGSRLLDDNEIDAAWSIARALAQLEGDTSSQIPVRTLAVGGQRMIRDITKVVRAQLREALVAERLDEVERLVDTWGDVIAEDSGAAVSAVRGLYLRGSSGKALRLLKLALHHHPDDFGLLRWAARVAGRSGDMTLATRAYGRLRHDFAAESESFRPEIDRFFNRLGVIGPRQVRELVAADRLDEAMELAAVLSVEVPGSDRLEREKQRMQRIIRLRLKDIDLGEADISAREGLLRKLASLNPGEESVLRRLALELMRQFRFSEAAEVWGRLLALNPANESAERSLERCRVMAVRSQKAVELQLDSEA